MKMDMKGISPVIATILLIALTVAAVGIVAAILSGITPATAPPTTQVSYDAYGYYNDDDVNSVRFSVRTYGGDTVSRTDVQINFVAKACNREGGVNETYDRDNSYQEVKGSITNLGADASAVNVTWDTSPIDPAVIAKTGPLDASSSTSIAGTYFFPGLETGKSSELSILYDGTDGVYYDITSISIVHVPSGTVLFEKTNVAVPSVFG